MIRHAIRRMFGSVRFRVALVAGTAFAITLIAVSVLLLRTLESRLIDDIRSADAHALQTQAVQLLTNGLPDKATGNPPQVGAGDGTVAFTIGATGGQVIVATADGSTPPTGALDAVVGGASGATGATGASGNAGVAVTLDQLHETTSAQFSTQAAVPIDATSARLLGLQGQTGPFLMSSVQVYPGLSLTTASSLAEVDNTLSTTRTVLWYVVPGLVLLVSGFAWLLVGRALRPVHALTARAATISATSLHERVPVPPVGDEVSDLATTINSMLDRIETADQVSRRLVSDASHELRTPITVMRTELEVARRDPDARWHDVSSNVLTEVDRLQALVDDLLLLARMSEAGSTAAPFSLLDTVRDVAGRRRAVDVDVCEPDDADRGDLVVLGDGDAVQRALDHVVANAARHATSRVEVMIDPGADDAHDHRVTVHVDDDGPGIDPADRARVLQRFVRLDEARTRDAGGSGIGLAVALDVMTAHGGGVQIGESTLGGARVSLTMCTQTSHA